MGTGDRTALVTSCAPPPGTRQHIPEEYAVGDIVYTRNGTRYELVSIGYKGYDAYIRYLDGPKAGRLNYIAEVNWLYK